MLVRLDIEAAIRLTELQEIQRGQIARRIVKEHIFGAGIGRTDRTSRRACMPIIHRGIKMQTGIS